MLASADSSNSPSQPVAVWHPTGAAKLLPLPHKPTLTPLQAFLFAGLAVLVTCAVHSGSLSAVLVLLAGALCEAFVFPFNLGRLGNAFSIFLSADPPELFYYAFLPPLLLDSALSIDFFLFKKASPASCLARLPCKASQGIWGCLCRRLGTFPGLQLLQTLQCIWTRMRCCLFSSHGTCVPQAITLAFMVAMGCTPAFQTCCMTHPDSSVLLSAGHAPGHCVCLPGGHRLCGAAHALPVVRAAPGPQRLEGERALACACWLSS